MTDNYVHLRKLEEGDVELMLEWMHDEAVNSKFRFDFASMTKDKVIDFISNSFSKETQHYAFVNNDNQYLGTISLKNISDTDKNAEYAIVTRTVAQGTGAAFQATMTILDYAFHHLSLHRVYLNVLDENVRANAFYRKCGFFYEGKFMEHLCLHKEYKDLNWYGMSRSQFDKMQIPINSDYLINLT